MAIEKKSLLTNSSSNKAASHKGDANAAKVAGSTVTASKTSALKVSALKANAMKVNTLKPMRTERFSGFLAAGGGVQQGSVDLVHLTLLHSSVHPLPR